MSGTYHIVPRDSEESDAAPLLAATPVSMVERQSEPALTHSFTSSSIVAILRVISTSFAVTAFVFWVVDGHRNFIAPCIFDLFIILLNIFQLFNYIVSDLLSITINLRSRPHSITLGNSHIKSRISMYFDIGLAFIFLALTIIGQSTKRHYYYGANLWMPGAVIAYVVFGLQMIIALPQVINKKFTFSVKVTSLKTDSDVRKGFPSKIKLGKETSHRYSEAEVPRPSTDSMV